MNKIVKNIFLGSFAFSLTILTVKFLKNKEKNNSKNDNEKNYIYLFNTDNNSTKEDLNNMEIEINEKIKKIS